MEITRSNPSLALHASCKSKGTGGPTSQMDFQKITNQLTGAINNFLEAHDDPKLSVEKLEKVQSKFWTTGLGNQAIFCSDLWNPLKEVVEILSQNPETKALPEKIHVRKKPVIFSTREGLDITLDLKDTEQGLIAHSACVNPGGSSINVARALNNFGTPFELVGLKGYGPRSAAFTKLLENESININNLYEINDDIRFYFCTFVDGKEFWIPSLSPCLSPSEIDKVTTRLLESCQNNKGETLAVANNPFIGASRSYMSEIITKSQEKSHMFVIYDTKLHVVGKDLLDSVLKAGPNMIKPNLAEFAEIVNVDKDKLRQDKDLIIHLAQELVEKYNLKVVLVSLDKDGALIIDKNRAAYATVPEIKVACTVGAGNTGIASMIDRSKKEQFSLKKLSDKHFKHILSAFVAGGAATATKPGTELATLEEVQDMEKKINVKFV
ncbi:MAG: hypothetical protein HY094_07485 [Candidatus Melainabacteria bacterium]|nr:hypothetical protein [Candidatus Melainabacteria bacterium]